MSLHTEMHTEMTTEMTTEMHIIQYFLYTIYILKDTIYMSLYRYESVFIDMSLYFT